MGRLRGCLWGALGALLGPLGCPLAAFGSLLGVIWGTFGSLWALIGPLWGHFGRLRVTLGAFGVVLGLFREAWEPLSRFLLFFYVFLCCLLFFELFYVFVCVFLLRRAWSRSRRKARPKTTKDAKHGLQSYASLLEFLTSVRSNAPN